MKAKAKATTKAAPKVKAKSAVKAKGPGAPKAKAVAKRTLKAGAKQTAAKAKSPGVPKAATKQPTACNHFLGERLHDPSFHPHLSGAARFSEAVAAWSRGKSRWVQQVPVVAARLRRMHAATAGVGCCPRAGGLRSRPV